MTGMLLAIESSQRSVSVALRASAGALYEIVAEGDPRERDLLLPSIDRICRDAGLVPRDLGAVAVSTGPGGFTGLRVAVATAKGLCESLGIPAMDVRSCLVTAEALRERWCARGNDVAVALASKGSGCWMSVVRLEHDQSIKVIGEGWSDQATVPSQVCALIADVHAPPALRSSAVEAGVEVMDPLFTARACLAVAERQMQSGEVCDALALQVRYPREPEAVLNWRARYPSGVDAPQRDIH
ncbi:MAG: tRNA (adenosine(37)-N6)-threonylcarbamoyltransferase complex dimerization subunit type 1 TsaB [Planctomycetes bacterium]|nr:tRNA (adenosine(37)-N6)-threonylcarbamoyltransferase complex dimerization subunit type 1 TsaB [Planctomycetota bacterium]